jgi:uncharacterized membrane protein
MSIVPLIPILIYAIVYVIGPSVSSIEHAFRYTLVALVLTLAIGAGIYEVVSSFKVKRPVSFRVKRFLSRTLFAAIFVLCFYGLSSFFAQLFSTVLRWQYILILSLLTLSLTMLALLQNPKTRRLVKKLTREEN